MSSRIWLLGHVSGSKILQTTTQKGVEGSFYARWAWLTSDQASWGLFHGIYPQSHAFGTPEAFRAM